MGGDAFFGLVFATGLTYGDGLNQCGLVSRSGFSNTGRRLRDCCSINTGRRLRDSCGTNSVCRLGDGCICSWAFSTVVGAPGVPNNNLNSSSASLARVLTRRLQ